MDGYKGTAIEGLRRGVKRVVSLKLHSRVRGEREVEASGVRCFFGRPLARGRITSNMIDLRPRSEL